jgi:hypothetical protein
MVKLTPLVANLTLILFIKNKNRRFLNFIISIGSNLWNGKFLVDFQNFKLVKPIGSPTSIKADLIKIIPLINLGIT